MAKLAERIDVLSDEIIQNQTSSYKYQKRGEPFVISAVIAGCVLLGFLGEIFNYGFVSLSTADKVTFFIGAAICGGSLFFYHRAREMKLFADAERKRLEEERERLRSLMAPF